MFRVIIKRRTHLVTVIFTNNSLTRIITLLQIDYLLQIGVPQTQKVEVDVKEKRIVKIKNVPLMGGIVINPSLY